MAKALVIAEKPSVARDIARALGGFKKQGDYYENDRYVVASAVGHLLELTPPEGVDPQSGKWTLERLPVIPPHFDLKPIDKARKRLNLLVKLIRRKDVDQLINACDAGREGELIFRHIVRHSGTKKPIRRLWLQSMTPEAIREGFRRLRSDEEMQPLAHAAVCRSEADWLVGINGTRAMTAFHSRPGTFRLTTVGRVQTPTLAIVVDRENKIRNFIPRDYWEVHAVFDTGAGVYTGRWFDESFDKAHSKTEDPDLKPERIWLRAQAEEIRERCLGKTGAAEERTKPVSRSAPLLFDLTSLQREANNRFGFSARNTLAAAQSLYERHKVLTYPRTDSRALPEDYLETVRNTLARLKAGGVFPEHAERILENGWVKRNPRIFNNAKVSDHFAIIPTGQAPKQLNDAERQIYELVARRFLAAFFPPARYLETVRITRVEGEPFRTEGRVLVDPGWMEVYGREADKPQAAALPPLPKPPEVPVVEIEIKQNTTKPPPRFTEATLLSAMEGAGKLVEDEELRAAMAQKGLGTPATRAQIIENLLHERYLRRQGKELIPTHKAFDLLRLLSLFGIEDLTRPELTGEWEHKLKQMERAALDPNRFMEEIRALTRRIVERIRDSRQQRLELKARCLKCDGAMAETPNRYECAACRWGFPATIAGRRLAPEEAEKLLTERRVGPLEGFFSKKGKPFSAELELTDEGKIQFVFPEAEPPEGEGETEADLAEREPIGPCPKCGANVRETASHYACEKSLRKPAGCDFTLSKSILQQPIEPAQARKLLREGRTDMLGNFVSRKSRRKFRAALVLRNGGVAFEFPEREKGAPKKKAARKKTAQAPPQPADFTGKEPLGACPKCGGRVFEGETDYLCEKAWDAEKPCNFRISKTILQQEITPEQARKLLAEGATDVLGGFVSNRTRRAFSARLALQRKPRVKIGFQFPKRAAEKSEEE